MDNGGVTTGGPVAIRKRTLHDQVADGIRDLIIEGYLEPGSRIDETRLIEQLEVSRTPFREALRTLAAEGLVIIRPSRGAVVRKLTAQDVFSMLEVLAHLEKLAGNLTCERASDEEIEALLSLHREMLALYEKRERLAYYKLNQDFHTMLSELSGNETLQEMQRNIQARLKRIRFMGNRKPEYWAAAVDEHEKMAECLSRRDGPALGDIMAGHLMNTWDRVKNSV
ncbi:GntR family transcriptional regulator [Vannielia litorea]|uniref:GntR family transcriptional regulator n=1 Tax=Vannielia TaxID=2813041 RepID=UPI001C98566E|nr:GntR family transcriptional regulator [Vannielia litorea]MBY6154337.1 GntR family transcriptional regulator [Vannielia litorea]